MNLDVEIVVDLFCMCLISLQGESALLSHFTESINKRTPVRHHSLQIRVTDPLMLGGKQQSF